MTAPQYLLIVSVSGDAVSAGAVSVGAVSGDAQPEASAGTASRLIDADAGYPQLSVLDVAATRGDGIFETFSVGRGYPQSFDAHLDRFARSARMLDLPAPDLSLWREAVLTLARRLADHPEAWIKIVLTRGIEGQPQPTGWAYGTVSPDFSRDRTDGISVVLLDRGLRSDVSATSPWLLAGAKTLSYAINRAAVREAQRRHADDVIFVSSDGLLLEGPTSTLVLRHGDTLATPPDAVGILCGTTQADLFATADQWGLTTAVRRLTIDDLLTADAAWLVSSVRHAAPVRAVDGTPRAVDGQLTRIMNAYLNARQS